METFKRTPTIRMLAAEVIATTVGLQSGQKDSYQPAIYLGPTGAEVNRVLIAGTAVEKEDVGTDNSFWRVRVADPTGVVFVYAGQYQPEAAKAIQKLEVPSFVIVSGKLSQYTPEQGGETIVSVRAESISTVSLELRDHALADITHHTVSRILEARKNEKVRDNYPYHDYSSFIQSITVLLDQILEDVPSVNTSPAPATPDPQPVPASTPAVTSPSPPADIPKPATQPQPPVQEPVKAPAAAEKTKRKSKKDGARKTADQAKDVSKEPLAPGDPAKEPPKGDVKTNGLQDSEALVLDILKTHKPQGALARDTIQNVLRALGFAMLDVNHILAKLKSAGEIIEPKDGFFRAM